MRKGASTSRGQKRTSWLQSSGAAHAADTIFHGASDSWLQMMTQGAFPLWTFMCSVKNGAVEEKESGLFGRKMRKKFPDFICEFCLFVRHDFQNNLPLFYIEGSFISGNNFFFEL
jgi:hypothetical protein